MKIDFSELERYQDDLPRLGGWPGSDCLVLLHGECVYRHQNGFADIQAKTPWTGHERVNLYSCSKVATCTTTSSRRSA